MSAFHGRHPAPEQSTRAAVPGRRRAVGLFAGGIALIAASTLGTSPTGATTSFRAVADARVVAGNFSPDPGIIFEQLVDAGAGVAQAEIDSLGGSRAFASDPYPSESVILLPGLLASLTQGQTSTLVPDYPLIAASTHPLTPSERVGAGTFALDARSDDSSSTADATNGGYRSRATASVDRASGEIVARAEVEIASLRLSESLALAGVRSVAEVRQRPGQDPDRLTTFEVAALDLLGQRVSLGAGGLSLLGSEVPVGSLAGPLAILLDALAVDGTTIEVVPAAETDTGVTSAGLRVVDRRTPPPELASGVESIVTELIVGQASASIAADAASETIPLPPPSPTGSGSGADQLPSAGPLAPSAPFVGPTSGGVGQAAPPAPAGEVAAGAAPVAATTGLTIAADTSLLGVYPFLVAAAAVLIGGVSIFRSLARRTP